MQRSYAGLFLPLKNNFRLISYKKRLYYFADELLISKTNPDSMEVIPRIRYWMRYWKYFFMSLIRFTMKWAPIEEVYSLSLLRKNSGFPAFATDVVPSSSVAGKGNLFHSAMHTRFHLILEFHIGHSKSKFNFDPFFKMGLKFFLPRPKNQIFNSCWELNLWFKEGQSFIKGEKNQI